MRVLLVLLCLTSVALDASADPSSRSEELKQEGLAAARKKD